MSEIRVATRYAKSFFDLAIEKNLLERVEQDALAFIDVASANRAFANMLKSPIVHADKKWHVMEKAFGSQFEKLTMEFIKIVLRKRRDYTLAMIFKQFMEMYREHKNIISATVYTAVPVTDKVKEEVRIFLAKRTDAQIELSNKIDTELLGGFVLKYEDKLVDASVASKLRNLRTQLINAN